MEREKGGVIDEGSGSRGGDDGRRGIERQQPKQQQEHELLLGVKLRRGISVGKRGGTSTPAPSWKVVDEDHNPHNQEKNISSHRRSTSSATAAAAISARKLGASLWETEDMLPISQVSRRDDCWMRHHHKCEKDSDLDDFYSPSKHEKAQKSRADQRLAAVILARHHKSIESCRGLEPATPSSHCRSTEAMTPTGSLDHKGKYGELGYNIKTSTELIKVLNRIWSLEEKHASNRSMMRAMKLELHYARAQIQKLVQEHQADRREIDNLLKHLSEQKILWKSKEREKVKVAIQSIKDEAEDERKLRKHSESLHRKLAKELSEMKSLYTKALKDLERERKMRNLLEDLCDEFAKGVGDYDVEVRELKQRAKHDAVHRCDRLILHISEAWLDERLQMKLAEARGDFTEANTVLDRLGCDVMSFLEAKRSNNFANGNMTQEAMKDSSLRRRSLESVHFNGATSAPQDAEDGDSIASDLHCFELNTRNDGTTREIQEHLETRRLNKGKKKIVHSGRTAGPSSSGGNLSIGEQRKQTSSSTVNKVNLANMAHEIHIDHQDGKEDVNRSDIDESVENGQSNVRADHLIENSGKRQTDFRNLCRAHPEDYHGEVNSGIFSYSHQSATVSGDVHSSSSPVQQWNFSNDPPNIAAAESSSRSQSGLSQNTLKAKLLEARLEGKHARLRTSKASSCA